MNFFLFWNICNKLLHNLDKKSFLPKMKSRNKPLHKADPKSRHGLRRKSSRFPGAISALS